MMLAVPTVSSFESAFAQTSHLEQGEHFAEPVPDESLISCICVAPRLADTAGLSRLKAYRLWFEQLLTNDGVARLPSPNGDARFSGTTGQGDDTRW
jgi:hypothetical protein